MIVTIDPGTMTAGLAVWSGKLWGIKNGIVPRPILVCVTNGSGWRKDQHGPEWTQSTLRVVEWIEIQTQHLNTIHQVWVEQMEFRSTHQGLAAVDDVLKVAFVCGAIAQWAVSKGASFHAAPVSWWKGNLSKQQVARRILKRWGVEDLDKEKGLKCMLSDPEKPSHDWDAIGIGLWAQGFFE